MPRVIKPEKPKFEVSNDLLRRFDDAKRSERWATESLTEISKINSLTSLRILLVNLNKYSHPIYLDALVRIVNKPEFQRYKKLVVDAFLRLSLQAHKDYVKEIRIRLLKLLDDNTNYYLINLLKTDLDPQIKYLIVGVLGNSKDDLVYRRMKLLLDELQDSKKSYELQGKLLIALVRLQPTLTIQTVLSVLRNPKTYILSTNTLIALRLYFKLKPNNKKIINDVFSIFESYNVDKVSTKLGKDIYYCLNNIREIAIKEKLWKRYVKLLKKYGQY